ncbi:stage II sporulation protein M [Marinilabiliaceae bacterium ANBcel2]|nr:stage II sporulation protein M [Marinilabiliaceae bacterium ANBcel2]
MKEVHFINKNRNRWLDFERQLESPSKIPPDQLASNYLLLTDDLSYARTFYPSSYIVEYLNDLSSKVHLLIYKNKREKGSRLFFFWLKELPEVIIFAKRYFVFSLLIFSVAIGIGVLSSINDPAFLNIVLGEQYVNMTIENIERGEPFGVYDTLSPFLMFVMITGNNIYVSFVVFLFGLFTPVGTAIILIKNGIMVGAFITFFFAHSLGVQSILTVMLHGTLELSAIVIAGGAGLLLGNSVLFPQTYTRLYSFKRGVVRGTKIMIGLIPFFIFAGIIESYITRYYDQMSIAVNSMIILFSLAIIIGYFILYPYYMYNNLNRSVNDQKNQFNYE